MIEIADIPYHVLMAGTHLTAGYYVAKKLGIIDRKRKAYSAVLNVTPDLDILVSSEFHRTLTHSLPFAGLIAALATLPEVYLSRKEETPNLKNKFLCYASSLLSHLYLDIWSGNIQPFPSINLNYPIIPSTDEPIGVINHAIALISLISGVELGSKIKQKISERKNKNVAEKTSLEDCLE